MSLYLLTAGYSGQAEGHLGICVGGDGGFGDVGVVTEPDGNDAIQISYAQTVSGTGQDRISAIVNDIGNAVDVLGVDSSFVLSGGIPITSVAGATATSADANGVIAIVYDVSDCGGSLYFVFDAAHNKICFPSYVCLYHELAHAYHIAIGDLDVGAPEVQAENDENGLRAQLGLPIRDANNHGGGCGGPPCPGGGTTNGCFIATAAYGSPLAPQVALLQLRRDRLLRDSPLGQAVYDGVRGEYYRFSPRVAGHMELAPSLRTAIRQIAVEPLVDFFALVEAYAAGGWADPGFAGRVGAARRQALTRLHHAGITEEQIERFHLTLRFIQAGYAFRERHAHLPPIPPEQAEMETVIEYLVRTADAALPDAVYLPWALLAPLVLWWSALAAGSPQAAVDDLIAGIERWLTDFPLPPGHVHEDATSLEADLEQLAFTLFTNPALRRVLGERLLRREPAASVADLERVLRRAGYGPEEGHHGG